MGASSSKKNTQPQNPYTPQSSTPGAPPPLDASADSLLQDYARLAAWEAETQVAAEVSRNTVSLQVRLGAARQAELPGLVAEQRRMAEVAASSAVHTRVAAWRLRLQGDSGEHRRLLEAEVERLVIAFASDLDHAQRDVQRLVGSDGPAPSSPSPNDGDLAPVNECQMWSSPTCGGPVVMPSVFNPEGAAQR